MKLPLPCRKSRRVIAEEKAPHLLPISSPSRCTCLSSHHLHSSSHYSRDVALRRYWREEEIWKKYEAVCIIIACSSLFATPAVRRLEMDGAYGLNTGVKASDIIICTASRKTSCALWLTIVKYYGEDERWKDGGGRQALRAQRRPPQLSGTLSLQHRG